MTQANDPPQCPPMPEPERFEHCRVVADRCIKCGEMLGDDYHVSHGAATCRKCANQAASDMATYPPMHRTNWDE